MNWFKRLVAKDQGPAPPGDPCCEGPQFGYPGSWCNTGGLTNYYTGLGTPRDQTTQGFYNYPRVFSRWELENAYRSSWICKRIVNLPPNDMTREWRKFTIGDDEDGLMVRTLEETERALQVKKRINQALKWSRLYGGSLIFLGIGDENPADELNLDSIRQGDLKWLLVLDRWNVDNTTNDYVYDVSNPLFGMPTFYRVLNGTEMWHSSRVIRFDGEELPLNLWQQNGRWNDSTLNHILQIVLNLEAAQRACLLAMQQGSLDVISIPNMRGMLGMDAAGMGRVRNRIQFFSDLKSVYRAAVKDADEKFERIAASLGGYDNLFERFQDEMCGAAEIPHTVLYGQSPAGLRATGDYDTRQYYDHISSRQENDLRPQLDYLDQVLVRSALGFMPAEYEFDFESLWQIDEDLQSQIHLRNAQRDDLYVKDGILEPEMIARQLLNDNVYSTLTHDDVEQIAAFNQPAGITQPIEPDVGEQPQPEQTPPGLIPAGARSALQPTNGTRVNVNAHTRGFPSRNLPRPEE